MIARRHRNGSAGWVEFGAIKAAVRLEQVLRHYGIQGLRRSGQAHYRGRCPIHGGEGLEAFHVDGSKNVFHCFACGAGGTVLDLVAAMERCGLREAALKLAGWFAVPGQPSSVPQASKELVTEKSKWPSPLSPLGFRLAPVDTAHPYLRRRGIEEWTAAEFGVGLYAGPGLLSGRVVIPIHDERGRLVAYCGRSLDGSEPRYKFPAGFRKSLVLFNLHRALAAGGDEVILVEGFFGAIWLYQSGYPQTVALMGTTMSAAQKELLSRHFGRVLLLLDGDAAGCQASVWIAAALAHAGLDVRTVELPPGGQPDQLSPPDLRALLAQM